MASEVLRGFLIPVIAGVGQGMFSAVSSILIKLLLWSARGSQYWQNKWVAEEKNHTSKSFLRNYLSREEMSHLAFLQATLLIPRHAEINTKWEFLRLLAVLEATNNGSSFAQVFVKGAISPFQTGRLSLTSHMGNLVDSVSTAASWSNDGINLLLNGA